MTGRADKNGWGEDAIARAVEPGRPTFAIGLAPRAAALLEIDAARAEQLALKRRYLAAAPEEVFAAEPGWEAAQAEAAALVREALGRALGAAWPEAETALGEAAPDGASPLLAAALTVQEDLLLMARDAPSAPFRLVAGSLSFPSHWSLREKLGRPMAEIHEPVPSFGPGARNAAVIDRIFAALAPAQSVERFGWSIAPDAALAQPPARYQNSGGAAPGFSAARAEIEAAARGPEAPHFRVERQTLTKLPTSGAILFTVRVHVLAFAAFADRADGPALAAALATRLANLDAAQTAYKGVGAARPALLSALAAAADRA